MPKKPAPVRALTGHMIKAIVRAEPSIVETDDCAWKTPDHYWQPVPSIELAEKIARKGRAVKLKSKHDSAVISNPDEIGVKEGKILERYPDGSVRIMYAHPDCDEGSDTAHHDFVWWNNSRREKNGLPYAMGEVWMYSPSHHAMNFAIIDLADNGLQFYFLDSRRGKSTLIYRPFPQYTYRCHFFKL